MFMILPSRVMQWFISEIAGLVSENFSGPQMGTASVRESGVSTAGLNEICKNPFPLSNIVSIV